MALEIDDAVGVWERERAEQNAVNETKDGTVRTDAERERDEGDGGEAFVLHKHAKGEPDVVQERVHGVARGLWRGRKFVDARTHPPARETRALPGICSGRVMGKGARGV